MYTVFVYGHIQGVGMTAYRILYCEAGEVGPNVTNNGKNSRMMSVKYIDHGFLAIILKHEVSKCTACPVLDGTLRSRRGGANVMKL